MGKGYFQMLNLLFLPFKLITTWSDPFCRIQKLQSQMWNHAHMFTFFVGCQDVLPGRDIAVSSRNYRFNYGSVSIMDL